jgi:Tat protein translocase TatB subunit
MASVPPGGAPRLGDVFNLSGSELIFLLLIALVVLGPEKLPEAVRKFGKTYGEFKKMTSGFQSELRSALDEPMREMKDTADAMRKAANFNFDGDTDGDTDEAVQAPNSSGPRLEPTAEPAAVPAAEPISVPLIPVIDPVIAAGSGEAGNDHEVMHIETQPNIEPTTIAADHEAAGE